MSATLSAHKDSHKVNEDAVRAIPSPAATATWHPISHGALLDQTLLLLADAGLKVGSKQFALSNDQNRMFGVFDVLNLDNADGSVSFAVGLRNSIDKTLPAGICFGARVFVCDNLAFSGEVSIHRRHTKNIMAELPTLMRDAVSQFGAFRDSHYRLFDALKLATITPDEVWAIVGKAYENGAVNKSKIADIVVEYRSEEHIAKHGTGTAWSLYNAGTEVFKTRQARNMIEAAGESIAWHALFVDMFGKRMESQKVVVPVTVTTVETVIVQPIALLEDLRGSD